MAKLVVSPKRYSAILHGSHVLDRGTSVVVIADGMEEYKQYGFCLEARRVQKQFELEKAYKVMGIHQLYTMNQDMNNVNYELVALKLQLLLSTGPYSQFYYMTNGDQRLTTVCTTVTGNVERLVYKERGKQKWAYTLTDDEIERKLEAIEKMYTIRRELLGYDMTTEYVQRK